MSLKDVPVTAAVDPIDTTGGEPRPRLARRLLRSRVASISALLVILFAVFSITQDNFLTYNNLMLLLLNVAMLFVVSIGLTFVLLVGGFDLSIGALLGLSGFILAFLYNSLNLTILLAIGLTVVFGAVVEFIHTASLIHDDIIDDSAMRRGRASMRASS